MLIIDRFEGNWAILEYSAGDVTFNIPRELMPDDAKEGDVINISINVDKKATEKQSSKINKLVEDLSE